MPMTGGSRREESNAECIASASHETPFREKMESWPNEHGLPNHTLSSSIKRRAVDRGEPSDVPSEEHVQAKALKRKMKELRRAD